MEKIIINADGAPAAIGPYAHAVAVGDFLFTSGSLGVDPVSGELAANISQQAELSLRNLGAILAEAGLDYSDVVKTTVFLRDMADFSVVNLVYAGFFSNDYPARSCVQVAQLPKGALVEIEAIAVRGHK